MRAAEYYVATNGLDSAIGSGSEPFKTIQKAADVMQPGDTCHVRAGTYREWIKPPRGGASESSRITYLAEPGAEVVIKGSEPITSWVRQTNGVWKVELPDSFFGSFNPFKINLSGKFLNHGQEHHLGMVYLNGEAFRECLALDEVSRTVQTFCIESGTSTTIIHANFGSVSPNDQLAEINVRECLLFPMIKGLQFIIIDGFSMKHAAANWAYFRAFQHAAVGTYWGKNWIIQNCRISDIRCVGIVCGNDPSSENTGFDAESTGHHIVRNNLIQRCGQAGIHGFKGWAGSLIENNLIEDINVGDEMGGYETGGIKLHDAVDVTIRNNVIRRVHAGFRAGKGEYAGIWIDWGAQGTRVTGNIVYDMTSWPLFLQNEHGPVLVDNNIFSGPLNSSAGSSVFVHNLFANCPWRRGLWKGAQTAYWKPHTGDLVEVAQVSFLNDRYLNNIFVERGTDTISNAPGYQIDWNIYYQGAAKSGWGDERSIVDGACAADVKFKSLANGVEVSFRANRAPRTVKGPKIASDLLGIFPPTGERLENPDGSPMTIDRDILGNPRAAANPTAGPLEKLEDGNNVVRLIVGPGNTTTTQRK